VADVPLSECIEVEPGMWLWGPTGNAYLRMKADCPKQISIARPDGARRTVASAQDLYNQWAGLPHDTDHNLDPGSGAPPADPAKGQHTFHQDAICADIWGDGFTWCQQNGLRYGFSRPLGNDQHHFQHDRVTATAALDVHPLDDAQEDDMAKPEFYDDSSTIYWPNGFFSSYDQAVYNAVKYYFVDSPGHEQPGTEGTVVREVWHANSYMAAATAAATATALGTTALKIDDADLVAKIIAAMPKPPTSFTVTAKS
jgi:hypothetical protein